MAPKVINCVCAPPHTSHTSASLASARSVLVSASILRTSMTRACRNRRSLNHSWSWRAAELSAASKLNAALKTPLGAFAYSSAIKPSGFGIPRRLQGAAEQLCSAEAHTEMLACLVRGGVA